MQMVLLVGNDVIHQGVARVNVLNVFVDKGSLEFVLWLVWWLN